MQKLILISLLLILFSGCSGTTEILINGSIDTNITNEYQNVVLKDTSQIDAFGRLRVSQVTSLLDIKQLYNEDPLFIDTKINLNGSYTWNNGDSSTTIKTINSGDYVIRQTKQVTNYQAGKSHQIFTTFYNFQPQTNIIKRVGYFSSSNTAPYNNSLDGLYLESSNGEICINVAKSGNIKKVCQNNWNIDKLDGNGTSGIVVDWSKDQILLIDFEWLGVGRVRWSLVIDGNIYSFHDSNHANNGVTGTYMTYPNQPMRWEIRQTGIGSGNFTHICTSIGTEGSENTLGVERSINTNGVSINTPSTSIKYVLLGLGLQNNKHHSVIDVLDFNLLSTTNDNFYWELHLNPTISGTLTYNNITNGVSQYTIGTGSQTITSDGTIIASGYGLQQSVISRQIESALRLGTSINGTTDKFILSVTPLSVNMNIHASLTFREVR